MHFHRECGSTCPHTVHRAVQTHHNMITQSAPAGSTLSPPLSPHVFSWRGARTPSVTGLIGKHLAPGNQSPSSTAHTHIQTLTQGFRGNCGAGGRRNYSVYRASQTLVMRGRGLRQRARGGLNKGMVCEHFGCKITFRTSSEFVIFGSSLLAYGTRVTFILYFRGKQKSCAQSLFSLYLSFVKGVIFYWIKNVMLNC